MQTKKSKKILKKPKKCKNCDKMIKECEEYKNGWQRALADYKNLQTEVENKRSELVKMSEVQILEEFLPVYEHLKMSISSPEVQADKSPWVEGVKYVLKQFRDILSAHGVEEVKTIGEQFDPNLHEAVSEEESDKTETGIVLKEISPGYKIKDKILKAARVVVVK